MFELNLDKHKLRKVSDVILLLILNDYLSPKEARAGLTRYLHFYNFERPHQSLDYLTPSQVYFKL